MLRLRTVLLVAALAGCGGAPTEPPALAPPPPKVTAPELEEEAATPDTTIDVLAAKPTEILLDGKPIGSTPIDDHKVSPGRHEVTFVDPDHGNRTMMVDVQEGDNQTVQSDPVPGIIESSGGDEKDKKK